MYLNKTTNCIKHPHLNLIRNIFTCRMLASKNFYTVLEIAPNTPMSGVKAAYYKLSKKYHPDINKDEEAAKKFRAITEAYEVLGNARLKKLYDKGVTLDNISGTEAPVEEETSEMKFHRKRQHRSEVPTDRHFKDYNFNAWIKAHYGDTYRREHEFRKRKERFENMKKSSSEDHLQSSTSYAVMGFFCATFYLIMLILVSENKHDRVIIKNDKEK